MPSVWNVNGKLKSERQFRDLRLVAAMWRLDKEKAKGHGPTYWPDFARWMTPEQMLGEL